MNNIIIHQTLSKIITTNAKNMSALFDNHQNIAQFIEDTKAMLPEAA